MLFIIPDIFPAAALNEICASANALTWVDGKRTAGKNAVSVKKNQQAVMDSTPGKQLEQELLRAIRTNTMVRTIARPKRFSRLMLSRTRSAGGYGYHIDNAIMGAGEKKFRADISFTLFLSDPDSYEGGELELELPGMAQSIKPPKGSLVLYPSTSIHQVAPVTKGERLVCVGWLETMVRSAEQREVLFDLENIRAELAGKLPADSSELLYLNKTISNLLRMWAEV